ncbi:phospho-2-dehydro-3-deoxyheptonate aldolase [Streptomyces minutiscleroticus]|uniref:Phospho-2-dehydro-3-deoxyheptonate aldolase n=1 Tax=Streptomyces minutiscleroticus TaxID=68238 RepID=A0A918P4M0_9ACTN|nr:3-deoxy-7-phosphoheptulonate synthase class II [Streptomyces minutiscleroticus]GGY17133.1 phospho-2-dehydro-3-deoxyheptonate aldolase [Streptomyces minutiscleroticus]
MTETPTTYGGVDPALARSLAGRTAAQQPHWPDERRVREVRAALGALPPLVAPAAVDRLTERLAEVAQGRALLLQGGDCAETFAGNTPEHLRANLRTLLHCATLLEVASALPVVPVGRIAGQYAKPRSRPVDSDGLPAYRGDIVHSAAATPEARRPDPQRMLTAYADAEAALDVVRATTAETHTELFAGHEALLLDYELPLVRDGYGLSGHFLWIGERTRDLDGAHVALARHIANPIGLKLGPGATPAQALAYAEALDPDRRPGRLTLISRMGADRVSDALPPLVEAVAAAGHPVVWLCDPMHGNTHATASGVKTRHFDRILAEVDGYFAVHRALGSHPGGLHLEFTGDDVTECLGGREDLREDQLSQRYLTACDPRLNGRQSLDLARLVAEILLRRPIRGDAVRV